MYKLHVRTCGPKIFNTLWTARLREKIQDSRFIQKELLYDTQSGDITIRSYKHIHKIQNINKRLRSWDSNMYHMQFSATSITLDLERISLYVLLVLGPAGLPTAAAWSWDRTNSYGSGWAGARDADAAALSGADVRLLSRPGRAPVGTSGLSTWPVGGTSSRQCKILRPDIAAARFVFRATFGVFMSSESVDIVGNLSLHFFLLHVFLKFKQFFLVATLERWLRYV